MIVHLLQRKESGQIGQSLCVLSHGRRNLDDFTSPRSWLHVCHFCWELKYLGVAGFLA